MSSYYTVITDYGLECLYECILNGEAFPASYMAIGDGGGSSYEPEKSQTGLKGLKYRAALSLKGKKDNYLYFDLQVPADESGYTIREAGVFDAAGNLLAVAKYPETVLNGVSDTLVESVFIEIQIELSDEAINQIIIDTSGNLATTEELEAYQKTAEKGEAGGYASLDESGKVPQEQLPESSIGADVELSNLTNTGKSQYNPFCINTGVTDEDGNPACLVLDRDTLATQGVFTCSTADGTIYEISDALALDVSGYGDGDYNVFIDPVEKTLSLLNNTIHVGNTFPAGAVTGDYLLNTSKVPYSLDQLTDSGIVTGLNAVWAGILAGGVGRMTLNPYNESISQQAANMDLSNLSDAGKVTASGFSMPSARYVDLTYISEAVLTAPANGWVTLIIEYASGSHTSTQLINITAGFLGFQSMYIAGESYIRFTIPVAKGDEFRGWNTPYGTVNSVTFRFIYAQGAESEA